MQPIRSILVGVDFTPCSAVALAQAVRLGRAWGAQVHAMHAIDTVVVTDLEQALAPLQRDIRDGLMRDAEKAWTRFAPDIEGAATLAIEVEINNRGLAFVEHARKIAADLIVVGAYSREDPDLGVGTVASTCVRKAPADVLLARDDHRGPYRRIVVGVDFSDTSHRALERAALLAASDGAELHVLHVFKAPWKLLHWAAPNPAATEALERKYREELRQRMHALSDALPSALDATRVQWVLYDHDGHRSGIVQYATEQLADLVVVGTRGRSNLRDLVLGSTAEKTLRDCTTSVLAVKPPA